MRKIALIAATAFFATVGIASAQQTVPTTPKNNPSIEQNEKNKNKGNVENQNEQDTKAKEQAPAPKRTN